MWKEVELTGWGRTAKGTMSLARPERVRHLEALGRASPAPAVGNCRSYGDAPLNAGGLGISTARLDRILGFDAETGVLNVEAGAMLGDLARIFAPIGWLPAVLPGTGFATIGGAIANDVHGKNHHHAGSFGAHVKSFSLATPTGLKVVKPGTALFRATLGGLGQTGPIVSAELQLLRAKGDVMIVTERRAESLTSFLPLLDQSEATYAVGWIDATASGAALGRGILEEGETGAGLVPPAKPSRRVPFDAPSALLSGPVVRLFNTAYFRRVPSSGRTVVRRIQDFFFPLDKIHSWNRLYGRAGFHQFQCVVPLTESEILRDMLKRISAAGLASPLAVLKRMGSGRAGHLSFPMEGYTLAVDFPNRGRAAGLIATLEDMTVEAKGRVYLAKDALLRSELAHSMYPELSEWRRTVAKADPSRAYLTDLVRRLKLRGDD